MTIRIYPSRLPGEPLEIHQHVTTTIRNWLSKNVEGFELAEQHPICVDVSGVRIPPESWVFTRITHKSDVRIYPIPAGPVAIPAWAVWTAVAVTVAAAAYSVYMMSQMQGMGVAATGTGDSLDLSPAKANTAKLGDPIREVFGLYQVFPDYLLQPVSRFKEQKKYFTNMFLSVGVGNFSISQADIKIGATPISSLGDDVSYTIYPPGADVTADARSENWYNSAEVGSTTSGTSGLDLGSTGPGTTSVNADAVTVNGNVVTLIGETSSNDDDEDDTVIPQAWIVGTVLTIEAPDSYTIISASGYSEIYGSVSELVPYVGMPISLGFNENDYELFVASYTAPVPAVPGVGGNASSITASAAPTTYNFTSSPVTFTISWRGNSYAISLTANYATMSGLLVVITSQLSGSGLVARDNSGRLQIIEDTSPFRGGAITSSSLPPSVFGSAPVSVTGTASSGGTAAVMAHIRLAYDSATGTPFTGVPQGLQRLSIGLLNNQYKITAIDGLNITVARLKDSVDIGGNPTTIVDTSWLGFVPRTMLDALVTSVNDDYDWIGPFMACPDGETISEIELNLVFPSGLIRYSGSNRKSKSVAVLVQYRPAGTGSAWIEKRLLYTDKTEDEIGFTESFTLGSKAQYEVRMRRESPVSGGSTRDDVYWQAMRSKLSARPNRYANLTTIALTIRTGNRIASQSDRRINIKATRIYDNYASRSISGALMHVMTSLGMDKIDTEAITALENNYWTPRGERFDFSADDDSTSALDVLKTIANAGMSYFLLSDGLCSVGREGVKPWTGIISPQETVTALKTSFKSPSADDYEGVDVTYINGTTWAEETVQCRIPGADTARKVEDYSLDGVLDQDVAYHIGMRRLMKYKYQRLTYETSTEMDARCYNYGDRLVLTDDIPGSNTTSCLITAMHYTGALITLTVSEPLDWSISNPRCLIRFQDGTASALQNPNRVDDYTLTLPYSPSLDVDEWIMEDPSVEPPRLIFCSSNQVGYDAILTEGAPSSDGTTDVTAIQYSDQYYSFDDAPYPGATY